MIVVSGVSAEDFAFLSFFIYKNVLPFSNCKIKTTLIPDVCIIYWNIKHHQYSIVLQNDLSQLAWVMKFGPEKCYTLSVNRSHSYTKYDKTLKGQSLLQKCMAIIISNSIACYTHINNAISQLINLYNKRGK